MTTETRELRPDEFYLAEKVWEQYRGQKADHVSGYPAADCHQGTAPVRLAAHQLAGQFLDCRYPLARLRCGKQDQPSGVRSIAQMSWFAQPFFASCPRLWRVLITSVSHPA